MNLATKRNLAVSMTLLVCTTGLFLFGVKEIRDQSQLLRDQMMTLEKQRNQETSYYRLQKTEGESREDREKLSHFFLEQGNDSIDFLTQVEDLAPQVGVVLQTKGLEEKSDKKTKEKWIEVQFVFSGTRSDVEKFVTVLESMPYLSQVNSVNLLAQSSTSWEATVTMKVFILTYDS